MKKALLLLTVVLALLSCKSGKKVPDVSGIKTNIRFLRFDRDFFSIDSNNVLQGLNQLDRNYPELTPIFLQNILGLDSASTLGGVRSFLSLNASIDSAVTVRFKDMDGVRKEFEKAFQFVSYYFPQYKLPASVITVTGPVDALAQSSGGYTPDFLGNNFLGISLQFYLGADYPVYHDPFFVEKVAPEYRSRRFSKEYIISDAMMLIVDDLFPDQSAGKPLVEQMIEKGKQWYLLDKFLPNAPDSVKTGYTRQQLDWCEQNEGLIWAEIVRNEDLNSISPTIIQTYIGEGPFTQGFSQENSPGNLGPWIGWQIVKKFAGKHPDMKPEEIMKTPARKILEEAKYKPK